MRSKVYGLSPCFLLGLNSNPDTSVISCLFDFFDFSTVNC